LEFEVLLSWRYGGLPQVRSPRSTLVVGAAWIAEEEEEEEVVVVEGLVQVIIGHVAEESCPRITC
jgi:hypothetical protein